MKKSISTLFLTFICALPSMGDKVTLNANSFDVLAQNMEADEVKTVVDQLKDAEEKGKPLGNGQYNLTATQAQASYTAAHPGQAEKEFKDAVEKKVADKNKNITNLNKENEGLSKKINAYNQQPDRIGGVESEKERWRSNEGKIIKEEGKIIKEEGKIEKSVQSAYKKVENIGQFGDAKKLLENKKLSANDRKALVAAIEHKFPTESIEDNLIQGMNRVHDAKNYKDYKAARDVIKKAPESEKAALKAAATAEHGWVRRILSKIRIPV